MNNWSIFYGNHLIKNVGHWCYISEILRHEDFYNFMYYYKYSLHSHSSVWLNIQTHWEGCCEICLIAFLPLSPQADQDHCWSLFVISTYLSNHAVDKRSICLVRRSKQSHLDESNVMRLSILIPANRSFNSSKKQFLVPKDCWPSKNQTWHIYFINLMYIS